MEGALKCVLFPERELLSVSLSAHQHRRRQQSCLHCGRCPFFDLWDHPYLTSAHFCPPPRIKQTYYYTINFTRPSMYFGSIGRHLRQSSLKAGTPRPNGLSKGHKRPPPSLPLAGIAPLPPLALARSLARSFIVCEIEGCRGIMRFANG